MPDVCDGISIPPAATSDAHPRKPRTGPPGDPQPQPAARPAWVRRSDRHARPLLELMRRFEPEKLAALGFPGIAEETTRLSPDGPRERIVAYQRTIRNLGEHRTGESHAAVRLDLEAMITHLRWEVDLMRLEARCLLPYVNLAQLVFSGFLSLVTSGTSSCPAAAVHRRLRRYAGLEDGYEPLARQAEALIRSGLRRGDLLGPWRESLLQDLRNGPRLLAAVRELIEERRRSGGAPWAQGTGTAKAYDTLQQQLADYHDFLRHEVLPRCRDEFRLPVELYAAQLLRHGVELPAEELSRRAEAAFEERRRQLDELATHLARERGWPPEPFPAVLRRLERERLAPESLLDHFRRRHRQLERLIAKADFATLPRRLPRIRLASQAESTVLPFAHLRWPPSFDPRCGAGELVLPAQTEDLGGEYATEASSWVLAAHEGLPGHALQISRLLEPDVSLARGSLGFNLAALEGWAVYAGSELAPELPLEARFLTLHRDLRRAAVAFLDPALHHGRLSREQAHHLLETRVGLTEPIARQTLWRITVWSPGQATSYFYGHNQLASLRTAVECRLGSAFDRRRYHDFLLAQGLLPMTILRRWVLERIGTGPQDVEAQKGAGEPPR